MPGQLSPALRTDIISTTLLQNANIDWDRKGLPLARDYGDIYFSVNDPVAESCHVFIEGNNLSERMADLGNSALVVGECGFGFGLNFLLTAEHFCRLAPAHSRLHYISCELHPVRLKDLRRFYAGLPASLLALAAVMLSHYPEQGKGLHRFQFSYRRRFITLDLVYDDATRAFQEISMASGIDAWFLDGFTPTRNEAMWQTRLFRALAIHSHPGTTLASYSVAGTVRRNLEAAGFRIEKHPGFGNKRHMLAGQYTPVRETPDKTGETWTNPWPSRIRGVGSVAIIGAGLAGCATAHALAVRGITVTLFEKAPDIASGSSGNPRGIVHLNAARKLSPAARFRLQAYNHAIRHYEVLSGNHDIGWQPGGLIQLAVTTTEKVKQQALAQANHYDPALLQYLGAEKASSIAGIPVPYGGLFQPRSGSVDPVALCQAWSRHGNIRLVTNTEVTGFSPAGSQWQIALQSETGTSHAGTIPESFDAVVLCHNGSTAGFADLPDYPCIANHGQTDTYILAEDAVRLPGVILSYKGYLLPWRHNKKNHVMIGGSYAPGWHNASQSADLARKNLALLKQFAPDIYQVLATRQESVSSRAGTRITTSDYLPLAGPVEITRACRQRFAGFSRNARKPVYARADYLPGMYVNLAHGSAGLTNIPLLAEYLASLICAESLPLLRDDIQAIHPLRFLIREMKRQKR